MIELERSSCLRNGKNLLKPLPGASLPPLFSSGFLSSMVNVKSIHLPREKVTATSTKSTQLGANKTALTRQLKRIIILWPLSSGTLKVVSSEQSSIKKLSSLFGNFASLVPLGICLRSSPTVQTFQLVFSYQV